MIFIKLVVDIVVAIIYPADAGLAFFEWELLRKRKRAIVVVVEEWVSC
jgi:uncharacterized membrane protein